MPDLVPGVARAISPLVRRILAPNPGVFTGPGTNTYLVGIDEVVQGHASNHLCFLLEAEQLLFSGDHIMNGSTVVIRPPDGDMAVYLDQLERLRTLRLRAIAPGHGDVIDEPIAKVDEYLTHRRAREAKVLDRLRRADTATVADLVPSVYDDVPEERHWIAASSLWAHLRKLAADGLATSSDVDADDSTWYAA